MRKYLSSLIFLTALTSTSPAAAAAHTGRAGKSVAPAEIMTADHSGPWFTGTLLSPSFSTIETGHFYFEPYLYLQKTVGAYDDNWKPSATDTKWTTTVQLPAYIGLMQGIDLSVAAEVIHNSFKGVHATEFGDMTLAADFQLYKSHHGGPLPSVKLSVHENVPFGKYQKLDPTKHGIDGVGAGNWNTGATLIVGDMYNLGNNHYLTARLAFDYTLPFEASVSGLNVYGGAPTTSGKVNVGGVYTTYFGLEYLFSQHIVLAFDAIYSYANAVSFSGTTPVESPVGYGVAEQITVAPAIEYNHNENFGIIAGVAWTAAGRNTSQFTNYIIAISIYL